MNHPLVEEELMQIGLRSGGILGLHGFGDGSYNLGWREYSADNRLVEICHYEWKSVISVVTL